MGCQHYIILIQLFLFMLNYVIIVIESFFYKKFKKGVIIMTKKTLSEEQKGELMSIGNIYREAIYTNDNVPKLLTQFSEDLKLLDGEISQTILSEILHFTSLVKSRDFFCVFRDWIDELYDRLLETLPNTVSFTIECRRKGVESTIRKLIRDYFDGSSINLYDLVAFRIIIDSLASENKLKTYCYIVKKTCISFFKEKFCVLCTPNKQVGSDPLAKDYIEVPKDNNYQSIHLAFRTLDMEFFEIQIRTLDMHEHATVGNSGHKKYKNKEDEIVSQYICFEAEKVKIPHFRVLCDGSIYDKVGLQDALHVEYRPKTF